MSAVHADRALHEMQKTALVLVGSAVIAFGVAAFIEPTGIICSGATGVSLIVQNLVGLPLSLISGVINVISLIAGLLLFGRAFAINTLLSSIASPLFLAAFEQMPGIANLTGDTMLSCLMAGVTTGAGIGLVIRAGASTGGVDVPVIWVARRFRLSTSAVMAVANFSILLLQIPFSNAEQVMYGLVNTFILSYAMDAVINMGQATDKVMAISKHSSEIRDELLEAGYGVTLVDIEFGMEHTMGKALVCVLPTREVSALEQRILEKDPSAFLLCTHGVRARGRGFTYDRFASFEGFEGLIDQEKAHASTK